MAEQQNPPPHRTMRDYMRPPVEDCTPGIRRPTIIANNFESSSHLSIWFNRINLEETRQRIQILERFQDLLRKCHRLKSWHYQGCSAETQILINAVCGGDLQSRNLEEAYELIELVASNYQPLVSERKVRKGVCEVGTLDVILAQNQLLTQQVSNLNKKIEGLQATSYVVEANTPSVIYPPCSLFHCSLYGNLSSPSARGTFSVNYVGQLNSQAIFSKIHVSLEIEII
ncbi:hypothetical protein L6164_026057 [Bauhinia variegata]|uniref:Uncharacterized protein n=1 Tax=Bauhinia variegata TaxID=167791 RepID=A0ACB9M2C0_BAUVA|nr:hypothetical protein L6164_026057 [Bauhinia variegata]